VEPRLYLHTSSSLEIDNKTIIIIIIIIVITVASLASTIRSLQHYVHGKQQISNGL